MWHPTDPSIPLAPQPFQRFVETGRVAKCSIGPLKGKLVVIVDVIDQNRVLIDGPCTGVGRQEYRMNNLHLTKFKLTFPYTSPTRVIRKAWKEADISAKWAATAWAKKSKQQKIVSLDEWGCGASGEGPPLSVVVPVMILYTIGMCRLNHK